MNLSLPYSTVWHMHKGKYVFSQLLDFLDRNGFNYLARKYDGDKYIKRLTCYNQLAVLSSVSCQTAKACAMLFLLLRLMLARLSIWDSVDTFPKAHWPRPIRNETTASLRSLPTGLLTKPESVELMTSSSLEVTYMPLIQRLSSFASRRSTGRCIERTRRKEA